MRLLFDWLLRKLSGGTSRVSQTKKILDKLALQSQRVLEKIKGRKKPREDSNREVEILLYQYSTQDEKYRFSEENLEAMHEAMACLSEEEMAVLTKRYWEAKSLEVIGNELGHLGDHKWATRKIAEVLTKLSKKLF